jgi:hypothetical protein
MKDNTVQTKFQTPLVPWLVVKVDNIARAVEVYRLEDSVGGVVSQLSSGGAAVV